LIASEFTSIYEVWNRDVVKGLFDMAHNIPLMCFGISKQYLKDEILTHKRRDSKATFLGVNPPNTKRKPRIHSE
jgi:hypothetical protein